jgi:hypothetical protein
MSKGVHVPPPGVLDVGQGDRLDIHAQEPVRRAGHGLRVPDHLIMSGQRRKNTMGASR